MEEYRGYIPATNATGQVTVNYRDYSEQVFKGCAISYRELPSTLTEVVKGLQRCFSDPQNQLGRLGIDIRRSTLITDAMKEAKKMKFSPNKKLKVHKLSVLVVLRLH